MKTFLISPFKHQAKRLALMSFLVVVCWFGLLVVSSIQDWKVAVENFQQSASGKKDRCESLFDITSTEIMAIDRGRCGKPTDGIDSSNLDSFSNMVRLSKQTKLWIECDSYEKKRRAELVAMQFASGCPTYSLTTDGDLKVLVLKSKKNEAPAPIIDYALKLNNLHYSIFPIVFFGLTVAMLFLCDVLRRWLTEKNLGWKRLILVGSITSGAMAAGLGLQDGKSGGDAIVAGIAAICIAAAAFVYGRMIFRWVTEGFSVENRNTNLTTPVTTQKIFLQQFSEQAVSEETVKAKTDIFKREDAKQRAELSAAKFWPRLWARCVDVSLCLLFVNIVAVFVPHTSWWEIYGSIGIFDLLVSMVFLNAVIFFYESFFISRFGATPGKMLFGLRVVSVDGGLPSASAARKRALYYLGLGLEFCIFMPYFQILGVIFVWRRKEKLQPWDLAGRTFTQQKEISETKFVISAVLAFILFAVVIFALVVAKQIAKSAM